MEEELHVRSLSAAVAENAMMLDRIHASINQCLVLLCGTSPRANPRGGYYDHGGLPAVTFCGKSAENEGRLDPRRTAAAPHGGRDRADPIRPTARMCAQTPPKSTQQL